MRPVVSARSSFSWSSASTAEGSSWRFRAPELYGPAGWLSGSSSVGQWLQVNLGSETMVYGVATQ
eukprot:654331-Rhodomonas_salina.1